MNGNKSHSGKNASGPICRKRMARDSDEGSDSFEAESDDDDEYDHGSDCNCGGDDAGSDFEEHEDGEYEGAAEDDEMGMDESPASMTKEEAAKFLSHTND
jgi:hypothetical protein